MSSITASLSAAAPAQVSAGQGSAAQVLRTLQAIPGQLASQARATAEARLQLLIETYRQLAPLADAQTLAALAKQIGSAAKALGETAAVASLPSSGAAAPATAPDPAQTSNAASDEGAKTILTQAGSVLVAIQRRLALAAAGARHADGLKAALATVNTAAWDVAAALDGFGGSASPSPAGTPPAAAINVLA